MAQQTKYLLVSLPNSISPSNDPDEAWTALNSSVSSDYGTTYRFNVPTFKIGNLDALIQQADDLAKLCQDSEVTTNRVGESLSGILDGDQEKIAHQKKINDKSIESYLQTFQWNRVKYRIDKPIAEVVSTLRKELVSIDNDVKIKFGQYNQTKNSLIAAQRKQTGNLATRSLISVVDPKTLIQDSEYLETHLIAVPKNQIKDFYKSYESLCGMIVPRSATEIASDDEFTLYAVSTFKKTSSEFISKCREKRWTPRDFRYEENSKQEEQRELDELTKNERKYWGEALRLGSTGFSESAMTWMHALALRTFVETILRYGLPPQFVCGLIMTTGKLAPKAKGTLDATYMYLGGNAISRDKKGRATKDDSGISSEMQAAGQGDGEYTPYVLYEFQIN